MDNINAPDYAFGLILAWARGASAEEYSFHPQGGLDWTEYSVGLDIRRMYALTNCLQNFHCRFKVFLFHDRELREFLCSTEQVNISHEFQWQFRFWNCSIVQRHSLILQTSQEHGELLEKLSALIK
jgi:hypothetical protein